MKITKRRLIAGFVSVSFWAILDWMIVSDGSPLDEYFLNTPKIRNMWADAHTVSYVVAMLLSGKARHLGTFVFMVFTGGLVFCSGVVICMAFESIGRIILGKNQEIS